MRTRRNSPSFARSHIQPRTVEEMFFIRNLLESSVAFTNTSLMAWRHNSAYPDRHCGNSWQNVCRNELVSKWLMHVAGELSTRVRDEVKTVSWFTVFPSFRVCEQLFNGVSTAKGHQRPDAVDKSLGCGWQFKVMHRISFRSTICE